VARLRRITEPEGESEPVLNDMAGSVGEALKEIRVLTYLLNPPNLERDGLELTAQRFLRGFGARTGLNIAFRAEGELLPIRATIQRAAFRVIQEALSNVHRHAAAAGVEVDVVRRGGVLTIRVADDGCGIGPVDIPGDGAAQLGVGIPGMRSRVAQFGGSLDVTSDGAGTVVKAEIPLREPRGVRPSDCYLGKSKVAEARRPHSGPDPSRAA
jgi:signal transduction histidine kinase